MFSSGNCYFDNFNSGCATIIRGPGNKGLMSISNSEVRIGNITVDGTGDLSVPLSVSGTTTIGLFTSYAYNVSGAILVINAPAISGNPYIFAINPYASSNTRLCFNTVAGTGAFNSLAQTGDMMIQFSKANSSETGALIICPWSGSATGIRITSGSIGTVSINGAGGINLNSTVNANSIILPAGNVQTNSII